MKLPPHIRLGFQSEKKGESPHYLRQVHGRDLVEVKTPEQMNTLLASPVSADGSWSLGSGVTLKVQTADCVPVLLFTEDPKGPIAAVHAGWRGVCQGIVEEALKHFPVDKTYAWIGPAIHSCHFEVREDLVKTFADAGRSCEKFLIKEGDHYRMDLIGMLEKTQLSRLPAERILKEDSKCTYCSSLPSYRRSGGTEERIVSWITKI